MSEHELWNELGNLYFLSGAYPQAVYAYVRSIQLDTEFGRPYSNLALTYVQQGKYSEAVELYRRSIELLVDQKEKAISWHRLGNVYRHLRDYRQAVIAYQRADELDPEGNEGREEPGQVLYAGSGTTIKRQPMTAEAEPPASDQEAASASDPDEELALPLPETETASWAPIEPTQYQQDISEAPEATSLMTWLEADQDDNPDLDSAFEQEAEDTAADFDAELPTGWLPIPEPFESGEAQNIPEADPGNALEPDANQPASYEDSDGASTPLRPANNQDSGTEEYAERMTPQVQVDVAELASTPSFVLAMQAEQTPQLQQTEPDQEELDFQSLENSAQEIEAIEVDIAKFKRMVQVNPRNSFAWDTLGSLYKSAGLYKEAILAHQQAISIDSSKALYYHHLGLVYAAEGRDEDAINAFQKVIELDPDYSLAHATLGGYYRKMGLEDLAQKHIGKAMRIIYDSENEYNRACLEAICGNVDQAIELLRIALRNKQTYVDWVLRDPDLDFIRGDPRFKQLISDYTR